MVKDSQHLIIKNYLKKHLLVESNITSFNNSLNYIFDFNLINYLLIKV